MHSAIYKHLLSDKKYGLTHSLLATKVMPTVVPLTVTPGLSIEQVLSFRTIESIKIVDSHTSIIIYKQITGDRRKIGGRRDCEASRLTAYSYFYSLILRQKLTWVLEAIMKWTDNTR